MATSLASQLTGIRSLNAARLASASALSSQSSYLFPPRTAASQDIETVFALGETGWSELCLEDANLERWPGGERLFGIDSKTTDRTMLSKQDNAHLDTTIQDFFDRVGSILLHKSTAKCIEWLVRRFRVHEFNSITVLRAFMPYHQTPQFARMLYILNISSESHLAFLYPLQKTTQPLPTSVLLSALLAPATSSRSLDTLRFITSTVSSDRAPHRAQILFWSSILVQFCARTAGVDAGAELSMGLSSSAKKSRGTSTLQQRQDNAQLVLSIILPSAVDIVRRKKLGVEMQLAGCLVLSAIGASFDLSADAVTSTIHSLAGAASDSRREPRLIDGILAATASLCGSLPPTQAQATISPAALTLLLAVPNIHSQISYLSRQYDLGSFLEAWVSSLAGSIHNNERARSQLIATLSLPPQESGISITLAQQIIEKLLLATEQATETISVLAALRQQKSSAWDAAVRHLTSDESTTKQHVAQVVRQVTLAGLTQLHGTSSSESEVETAASWVELNSTEPAQRLLALKSLFRTLTASAIPEQGADSFFRDGLLARVADDDPAILQLLYSDGAKVLLQAVPSMESLLQAVEVACTPSADLTHRVLQAHLDFLLGPFLSKYPKASNRVLRNILWPRLLIVKSNRKAAEVTRNAIQQAAKVAPEQLRQSLFTQLQGVGHEEPKTAQDTTPCNSSLVQGLSRAYLAVEGQSHWNAHIAFLFSQVQDKDSLSVTPAGRALAFLTLAALLRDAQDDVRFTSLGQRLLRTCGSKALAVHPSAPAIELETTLEMWQYLYEHTARSEPLLLGHTVLALASSLHLQPSANGHLTGLAELALESASSHVGIARSLYQWANSESQNATIGRQVLAVIFRLLGESAAIFLAGIWIKHAEQDSGLAAIALRHTRTFLSAYASEAIARPFDFQTLIPVLLIAISSQSLDARKEAVGCIRLILQLAKSCCERPDRVQIWGYDTVYGPGSEDLKYLDSSSTHRLCSELLAHAEALISDSAYLPGLLGGVLTTLKGQDKREVTFRRSTTSYLLSHLNACPALTIKLGLLQAIARVHDSTKLPPLLPLIQKLTEAGKHKQVGEHLSALDADAREDFLRLLFDNFDKRSKVVLEDAGTGAWQCLLEAVACGDDSVSRFASLGLRNVYTALRPDYRKTAVEELAKVLANSDLKAPKEIRETLYSLDIEPSTLVLLLAQLRNTISEKSALESPTAKKARTEVSPAAASNAAIGILTEMLEASLSRNLPSVPAFISELFEILRIVVELHTARTINGDYLLHLTLSNLTKQLGSAARTGDVVQSLRVDTVINVVKASSNPSTFQQALLLLSSMANLAPETVIHSAMPIFTFVGSTVLQRDDAYSFSVVERVLASIIPPLIKHLNDSIALKAPKGGQAQYEVLKASRSFLCIFTDSANHIPRHRRQNFFQSLVEVLGVTPYTAALCMLLVDRSSHKISRQSGESALATLQLPLAVLTAQTSWVQLESLNEIFSEIKRLWEKRDVDPTESDQDLFLTRLNRVRGEHAEKQVDAKTQIVSLLSFVTKAVASRGFRLKVHEGDLRLPGMYHTFVEHTLTLQELQDEEIAEHAKEALSAMMSIVPVDTFMSSIEQLLAGGKMADKALQLVATRLTTLSATERASIADSTPSIVKNIHEKMSFGQSEQDLWTALGALEAVAATNQPQEHASLAVVLPDLLALLEKGERSSAERTRAFTVVHKLAGSLGPRLIPHIKRIVSVCIDTVSCAKPSQTSPTAYALCLDTLSKLFSSVSSFMEPFVQSVVEMSANANVKTHAAETIAVSKAFSSVLTTLIKRTSSEKVFAATFAAWRDADHGARLSLLGFLQRTLRVVDRDAIASNYKAVFRFILQVLDGRRQNKSSTLVQIGAVEDSAIKAFVKLVMKLNETTFRPLFLRIFDWAALDLADDDMAVSDDGLVSRRIALYKLNNALHDQLKSLISHYYSTMLDLTIELLEAYRAKKLQNAELWSAIISSVTKSAQYDQGTFWNPARLQKLTPSFIGQLSLPLRNADVVSNLGSPSVVCSSVTPAVRNLAKVVPDEASLKVINGSLLTQLRQDAVSIRVATLNVLTDMWSESSLSNVLLGLVPETVPHIAELMEVDEGEVVEATREFVAAVEAVLGESIEGYLE